MSELIQKLSGVASYPELLRAVRRAMAEGRTRAECAVEREKVRTSWEIGKLILDHILLNKDRADYGAYVIQRLSKDLGFSLSELKYTVEFVRAYPIGLPGGQLSWSHYKALLAINERKKRDEFAARAVAENWGRDKLRVQIAQLKKAGVESVTLRPKETPLRAKPGTLGTYVIVERGGTLKIDLGFSCYLDLPAGTKKKFKAGDIVSSAGNARAIKVLPAKNGTAEDLFTYEVRLLEVTDGDTIWVLVELGFGISTMQQLRLRAIDAPEIQTADGLSAQKALARMLTTRKDTGKVAERKKRAPVIIRTVKSDKYDRYLADIWSVSTYVNQRLIDRGYAVQIGN